MSGRHSICRACWGLLVSVVVLAAACGRSLAPADRVAEIDGEPIAYAAFEDYLRDNSVDGTGVLGSDVLSSLLDQFLDERLLCRLAEARLGLTEIADGRAAAAALLSEEPDEPPANAVATYYRQHQARFDRPERIHLRQMLFTERSAAEEIRHLWAGGAPYQTVLDRVAENSAAHAGEEGEFARHDLPAAFADALFDLEEGSVSDVLVADYGFHVFQVVRHLPAGLVPLPMVAEQIGDELATQQRQRELEKLVAEARERYNVRVFGRNVPFNYQGEFDSNLNHENR